MAEIIITTPDELVSIIRKTITEALNLQESTPDYPDKLTLDGAIELLKKEGFPTSKAKIYKLTSNDQIPFGKYGNKLIFSSKELLTWCNAQIKE